MGVQKEILGSKSDSLKGKLIVLGITGSVACVKSFELCRELIRHGAKVQIVASRAALELAGEKLLEFASGKKVITQISGQVEHVKYFGKKGKADLMLVAPATANTISKIAMGIDDTPITTFASVAIGSKKPVLIAPAMHKPMYEHPIVQKNLELLKEKSMVKIISPLLKEEKAKISSVESIVLEVQAALSKKRFLGKKVLVIAGTTKEQIDPVRILSTNASGKTGEELAKEFFRRGAQVTLLCNKDFFFPQIKTTKFFSFDELREKTFFELENGFDFLFCPAAIGDFEVRKSKNKVSSKKKFLLELFPRKKLLQEIRAKYPKLFICAFKAETNISKIVLEKKCRAFLEKNKFQMVVGNDAQKGGFGGDSNEVLILMRKKTFFVKGKKEKIVKKLVEEIK